MKLYLVRHGETEGNLQNFFQTAETQLTKTGIDQAKRVAKRLKNKKADIIYSSTHFRTMETSKIISKEIELPIEPWADLTEIRRPSEIRGKPTQDPEVAKIENLLAKNFTKKGWRYSDEENYDDLVRRARKVLDHLSSKHQDQTVLCVSHGTFIKTLLATALFGESLTPEIFSTLRHKMWAANTGITTIEHTEKHGWRLLTWNDASHL